MTPWKSRWQYFAERASGCVGAYMQGRVQTPGQRVGFVRTIEKLPAGSKQWCWMRLRIALSRAEYHDLIVIRDEQRSEKQRMARWRS